MKEAATLRTSGHGAAAREKLAAAAKLCPYLAEVWVMMESRKSEGEHGRRNHAAFCLEVR